MSTLTHRFSVAPMMDWTDRHCRAFHRVLTRRARLYTEMVTAGAVLFGDRARLLAFDPAERPLALQLGGAEPAAMAECARIAEGLGFDEVNINVGCPSDRVQAGRFGACLMAEPGTVAACVAAMRRATPVPVTVKCRIGVDAQEGYAPFRAFVDRVADAGCRVFVVHARKAWLKGLSPKENREVPPLRYDYVHRLKGERPELTVVLNGGLADLEQAAGHLPHVDGVMLGRAAYQSPWVLAEVDRRFFGDERPAPMRRAAIERFLPYVERRLAEGVPLVAMTRHLLGLYQGVPGAKAWRRTLGEEARRPGAGPELLLAALDRIEPLADAA